jgi:hypothetical protein
VLLVACKTNFRLSGLLVYILGTGKLSIYGPTFPDENLTAHKHDKAGMVGDA